MAESRSPYRDSSKPPLRLVGLIILVALAAGGYCICNAVGEPILRNLAENQCPIGNGQNMIEWTRKPAVSVNGRFLLMSGRTKGEIPIHDVYSENYRAYPTFSMAEIDSQTEEYTLLANIWPQDWEPLFEGIEGHRIFAVADGYEVSSSEFDIRARLSDHIKQALNSGTRVAVLVWEEQDPEAISEPLGAECIEE